MEGSYMKRNIILLPVAILVGGFVIMLILLSFRKDPPKSLPALKSKIVEAEIVSLKKVPSKIVAYGRLTSAQPIILISEVNGTIVAGDIPFQPAQAFKKGDLLLKIDDRQIRLDINSTKSDFLNALASVLPEIKVDFPDEYAIWQTYFNNCEFNKKLTPLPQAKNQKIKLFLSRFNVFKLYFLARNLEIQLERNTV